ncbi:hypothetical protein BV902_02245 [Sphingobacterium sp. B29]|uniref:hypothetical protein n=1 Tax=Sphingobacterium sp. B29 TaxID=1933220 RepID=UPI000957DAC6|nr:hypothetical protein [Sphingobacterium sp. B29]APU95297.1 hypothetical protein BV902_02245 [Sphingobacterium sp. B29]
MRIRATILIYIVLFFSKISAQSRFTIYYSKSLHNSDVNKELESLGNFKNYRLITQHFIDPKNTGQIDIDLLGKKIIEFYPNTSTEDLVCLDLENNLYKDLLKYDKTDKRFINAEEGFISMVKLINRIRPNLKVGIYAIPQRYYYKKSKQLDDEKFDEILKYCDVIMPSLYMMYPDRQVGGNSNKSYLEDNIKQALAYGIRLKKPVIPFVWSMIHPSNKTHAYQLISENEMKSYISVIKNYRYKGTSVAGLVWWETNEKIFNNWYKQYYKNCLQVDYRINLYLTI